MREATREVARTCPGRRIELWLMDEARVGQKGRTGHRWWLRGERPRGLCDRRFEAAHVCGAVRPATGDGVALIRPTVSTEAMQVLLDEFAARLAADAPAVLPLDGAEWHASGALVVPDRVSLVRLPPRSPELNPMERIWLCLRERFLSHRVFADHDDIRQARAEAWRALTRDTLKSLTAFPWLEQISS